MYHIPYAYKWNQTTINILLLGWPMCCWGTLSGTGCPRASRCSFSNCRSLRIPASRRLFTNICLPAFLAPNCCKYMRIICGRYGPMGCTVPPSQLAISSICGACCARISASMVVPSKWLREVPSWSGTSLRQRSTTQLLKLKARRSSTAFLGGILC